MRSFCFRILSEEVRKVKSCVLPAKCIPGAWIVKLKETVFSYIVYMKLSETGE